MRDEIDLWDGLIEIPRAAPDRRLETFKAHREQAFAKLEAKRQELLSCLQSTYELTDRPFDERRAWLGIEVSAHTYLVHKDMQENDMSPAACRQRFREIAESIWNLRSELERALREPDISNELMWSWFETAQLEDGLYHVEWAFRDMVISFAAFEKRLHQATAEIPIKRGAKRSPKRRCIFELATTFRSCTGKVPGAGDGPFARFVCTFFEIIESDKSDTSEVLDLIKSVRAEAQTILKFSPFDKSIPHSYFNPPD
jgi:hypothetical protein